MTPIHHQHQYPKQDAWFTGQRSCFEIEVEVPASQLDEEGPPDATVAGLCGWFLRPFSMSSAEVTVSVSLDHCVFE